MQKEIEGYLKKNKFPDQKTGISNNLQENKVQDYDNTSIFTICNLINERIKVFNEGDQPYELTIKYKIKVSVHILGNAIPLFKQIHRNYRNEHDPQHFLDKELKPTLRDFFVETVSTCEQEKTAAGMLITSLEKAILASLKRELPQIVADNVKEESDKLFHAKKNLYAKVLEDLGSKSFDKYISFLDDPHEYMKTWLKGFVDEYCSRKNKNGKSNLVNVVNEKIGTLVSTLKKRVVEVNQSVDKESGISFKTWLTNLHSIATKTVPFNDDVFDIYGMQQVKDIKYFEDWISQGLESLTTHSEIFKELFIARNMETGTETPPYELLASNVLGCAKKCPFCYAICTLTIDKHVGSCSTSNHRPIGLSGYRKSSTKMMVLESCNMKVMGNATFTCNDYSCKCWEDHDPGHKYKEYKVVYPSWDIAPDTSIEGAAYWKWVFCNFSKELEKHYSAICPELPDSWKKITLDQANKSLSDYK